MRTRLRHLCLNADGSEISGIIDRVSFFTASEPWGECHPHTFTGPLTCRKYAAEPFERLHVFGKDVIPPYLFQNTYIKPVGLWYGYQGMRVAAYRLGIL